MAALNRHIIDSEHYVARYARGSLTAAESECFEEYCVLHPEVAEQVSTDRALLAGLRAQESGVPVERPRWQFALAAGIAALVIAVGAAFYGSSTPAQALYASDGSAAALPAIRVVQQRGAVQEIHSSQERTRLLLHAVMPAGTAASDFAVTLVERTSPSEISHGPLTVTAQLIDGELILPVVVDAAALRSTSLRLDVEGAGTRLSFDLRVPNLQ